MPRYGFDYRDDRGDFGRPSRPSRYWRGGASYGHDFRGAQRGPRGGWDGGYPEARGGFVGGPDAAGYDRGFRGYAQRGGYGGYGGGGFEWQGGFDASRERVAEQYGLSDADRISAADIMTESPEFVTPDTTLADVARRMKELDVGIIPVVDDETARRLRGVVTDRDLAIRALAAGKDGSATVREVMTTDVDTVGRFATVRDVMDTMKRSRVRRVPVVGDDGELVGIVAQADLAVGYAGLDTIRENEVEEVIERISEPAGARRRSQPLRGARTNQPTTYRYDRDLTDRIREGTDRLREGVREGWQELRQTARSLMGDRYDRGY